MRVTGLDRRLKTVIFVLFVVFVCGAVAFPFYWMIVSALQTGRGLFTYPPMLYPDNFEFKSFRTVLSNTGLPRWLWNSFLVSLASSLGALLVGAPGAYALSRFRYRGKNLFAILILTTQMMPPLVLVIPLFVIFRHLHLSDSLTGLVLANFTFALPVCVWMLRAIFDSIPEEIEEAARIDGCSYGQVLIRITAPLALPGFVATGIFAFLTSWDEFMFSRTVITAKDKWVASIGLSSFIGEYITPWDEIMAAATLFTVPPVILFLLVQRYFVAGLAAGGVKG